jgi:hypothetical protein
MSDEDVYIHSTYIHTQIRVATERDPELFLYKSERESVCGWVGGCVQQGTSRNSVRRLEAQHVIFLDESRDRFGESHRMKGGGIGTGIGIGLLVFCI